MIWSQGLPIIYPQNLIPIPKAPLFCLASRDAVFGFGGCRRRRMDERQSLQVRAGFNAQFGHVRDGGA